MALHFGLLVCQLLALQFDAEIHRKNNQKGKLV